MEFAPFLAQTEQSLNSMLKDLGFTSLDQLYWKAVPELFANGSSWNTDNYYGLSEQRLREKFNAILSKNLSFYSSFLGAGYYNHYLPSAVKQIVMRSEFYTAYTPYQPEASQGSLQAIYEYQSLISRLTKMDVSNASLYDGGSALFEATMMAIRTNSRNKIVLDDKVNPLYKRMLASYTASLNVEILELPREDILKLDMEKVSAVVLQMPDFLGQVFDVSRFSEVAHSYGALVIQVFYPISVALIKPPGEMGVDIAVGEGQSLGLGLNFGGPYLGILAAKKSLVRKMPGRIVGRTVDRNNKECFVLTLQAREQHIRREKATSNICSNQALCALQSLVYCCLMGRDGLREVALRSHLNAVYAYRRMVDLGIRVITSSNFFNEFAVVVPELDEFYVKAIEKGIIPGLRLKKFYPNSKEYSNVLLLAFTEKNTEKEIDKCLDLFKDHIRN